MIVKPERAPSGIPGMDQLMEGGFVKRSVNLISGGPGAGKTIFLQQYVYYGIVTNNEPGLMVSFEEDSPHLKKDVIRFGWDMDTLEQKGMCTYRYFQPTSLAEIQAELTNTIIQKKVKRVAIDSLSVLTMSLKDAYMIRKQLFAIVTRLKKLDCTTLISAEIVGETPLDMSGGQYSREGVVEFVADAVITLHSSGLGGEADRALRIVKMRQTNHERGPIPMAITKQGIRVFPNKK